MIDHIDTKDSASTESLAEQAKAAGQDFADKARQYTESSTDTLKDRPSDFADAAKGLASDASEKLQDAVKERQSTGAEYVSGLAETMRRAAREFDADLPIAGTYIRKAASQVEGLSDTIRTGSFNDLVRNAQSFARRQPTAFLGIAVLAGFGVVRFLKSSSDAASGTDRWNSSSPGRAANTGYRDDFSN